MISLAQRIRSELWGFFALAGLFFVHTGIVLSVFALKQVTPHPVLMKVFGVFLVNLGVICTLASWFFHRQKREKRPMFPCCARWCPNCCDCEADLSVLEDEIEIRKIKSERKIAPVSVGFSTIEFKMYSDFMKRETRGVEGCPNDKNPDLSKTQNHTNHISEKERRHRQEHRKKSRHHNHNAAIQIDDKNHHFHSNSISPHTLNL